LSDLLLRNGFPLALINSIFKTVKFKINSGKLTTNKETLNTQDAKYIPVPFYQGTTKVFENRILNFAKRYLRMPIKVYFTNFRKLKEGFGLISKVPEQNWSSIVYSYECNVCQATYIGRSNRRFYQRIREHSIQKASHVFQHCAKFNHNFNAGSFKVLCKARRNDNLDIMELFYILKYKPQINVQNNYVCTLCL